MSFLDSNHTCISIASTILSQRSHSGKKKKGTAVADATTAHAGAAAHTVAGETALEAVETEVIHFKEFFKRQFSYLKKEFPTLVMLMQISLVIPMTSVDPERGFSCMNRIKTKSRNKLSNLVLDHLMRISLSSAYNLREFMMRFGTIVVRKFLGMRNRKFDTLSWEERARAKVVESPIVAYLEEDDDNSVDQ